MKDIDKPQQIHHHQTEIAQTRRDLHDMNIGQWQKIRPDSRRDHLEKTIVHRFSDMPTRIKTHLVKSLVLPVLDYPSVSNHALSKKQLSKLRMQSFKTEASADLRQTKGIRAL